MSNNDLVSLFGVHQVTLPPNLIVLEAIPQSGMQSFNNYKTNMIIFNNIFIYQVWETCLLESLPMLLKNEPKQLYLYYYINHQFLLFDCTYLSKELPVVVQGITKIFNGEAGIKKAVNDLAFTVEFGECFGLIGPNGGGKKTIINFLLFKYI